LKGGEHLEWFWTCVWHNHLCPSINLC
jgi:hypothetical protein